MSSRPASCRAGCVGAHLIRTVAGGAHEDVRDLVAHSLRPAARIDPPARYDDAVRSGPTITIQAAALLLVLALLVLPL